MITRLLRYLAYGRKPPSFDPEEVTNVLNGKKYRLDVAFIWSQSKQGHDFWWHEFYRDNLLSNQAASILRAWLND
jgi:hypothetical protein